MSAIARAMRPFPSSNGWGTLPTTPSVTRVESRDYNLCSFHAALIVHPLWSPDGRELYYRTGVSPEELEQRALAQKTLLMAVPSETKPTFKAGRPRKLFEGPYFESGHDIAVTPDGKGFILIRETETQTGPREIQVVLNWPEELKKRVK